MYFIYVETLNGSNISRFYQACRCRVNLAGSLIAIAIVITLFCTETKHKCFVSEWVREIRIPTVL